MTLENVLVLCAPRGLMPVDTHQSLQKLQAARAVIQDGGSQTDVTLTRCIQAATAFKMLKERPSLEWVFWFDQDMVCEPSSVEALRDFSIRLSDSGLQAPDSELQQEKKSYPSLSGVYVNRHRQEPSVAATKLKNEDVVVLNSPHAGASRPEPMFVPALTGMGCLLQHRTSFIAHCNESLQFHYPVYGNLLPQICESRLATKGEYDPYIDTIGDVETLYWMHEDFSYTLREIKAGRRVFVAPVPFGHIVSSVLWPDSKTIFPGLQPSAIDSRPEEKTTSTPVDSRRPLEAPEGVMPIANNQAPITESVLCPD